MQFNSVKRGNFSGLARSVSRSAAQAFDAARTSATDHTAIAKEAIKGRSMERRAAMEAEGKVARAGLQAFATVKDTKNDIDSAKKINDIKRPARRMAGVVAGLGAISQAAVMNKNLKDDRRERAEMKALEQQSFETKMGIIRGEQEQVRAMIEQMRSGLGNTSVPAVDTSGSTNTTKPSSSSSPAQVKPAPSTPVSSSSSKSTGNPRMQYMQKLTSQGMTPTQAAATVGHLIVETGNFKHMEELVPNRHGTRGYGHLQWTDPTPGRGRRTDFTNWTKSQGLNPSSFEANSGFLTHEMTTNFNGSWNRGSNFQGFRQTGSMEDASTYLRQNYIRPSAGSEQRRINEGYRVLDEWNAFNS